MPAAFWKLERQKLERSAVETGYRAFSAAASSHVVSKGPDSLAEMSRSPESLDTVWALGVTLVWREELNHAKVTAVRATASKSTQTAAITSLLACGLFESVRISHPFPSPSRQQSAAPATRGWCSRGCSCSPRRSPRATRRRRPAPACRGRRRRRRPAGCTAALRRPAA